LQGENQVTRVPTEAAIRVSLWGTPQGKISVLWNRTPNPQNYALEAAMPTATLVNRWGDTQTVAAANSYYTLSLPVATANLVSNPDDYIVGGDPLILIETDTVSPTSALLPLPPINQGNPITLTWTAGDDASGVWYLQIQASTAPDGPWTTVAGLNETQGTTQTIFYNGHDVTYYFRARARDRVGNWEAWPPGYEVRTRVDAITELRLGVDALFNDSNRNGVWDPVVTGTLKPEITATHVSMRFVDEDWHTIRSVISDSWHFTETLLPGTYTFIAEWDDADGDRWIYLESMDLDGAVDPLYKPALNPTGLLPRTDFALPLFFHNWY
jgi:hypothetical protein